MRNGLAAAAPVADEDTGVAKRLSFLDRYLTLWIFIAIRRRYFAGELGAAGLDIQPAE